MALAARSSLPFALSQNGSKRQCLCSPARAASVKGPPALELEYNKFGPSDLTVSEICMGTMTFGFQNSEKEAFEMLSYAWDCGVNFLDSSEGYPVPPQRATQGLSSTYIGNWMKTRKREDVIVATKVAGNAVFPVWIPADRTVPRGVETPTVVTGKAITQACDGELRRMQTDYLDLFQIHWPDRYLPGFGMHQYHAEKERSFVSYDEQVQAMGELIEAGKIRHWGLSNESSYGTMMMCMAADRLNVPRPVSIQNSYNLLGRSFDSELAEVCSPKNLNLALLPWSAAAGGALSGKYIGGQTPEGSRFDVMFGRYPRFYSERAETAVKAYMEIAKEAGLTPMELAYLFCKSRWFIPSVIIGATKMEQLEEDIGAFGKKLSEETLQQIEETHLEYTNPEHID